ncbi:MAG: gluconolactonase [Lachnospiraceae bacterium]|nr:gluconolactonase [Lachnospiraceae bacterium]
MRSLILIAACFLIAAETTVAVADSVPYDTYNYDYRENIVPTPAAYVPLRSVSGVSLLWNDESIGAFQSPEDLCVSADNKVYLADTGNKRVVVLNLAMTEVLEVIDSYDYNGTKTEFGSVTGLAISNSNQLYIADKTAKRVIVLESADKDRKYVKCIENPQSELFSEDFSFTPTKVTVDYADRVYVIAQGKTEGIMAFDENGEFTSFFGTIGVSLSPWQKFWRRLATKEQRAKQQMFIATEYTGVDIDEAGFVYATYIDENAKRSVQRLNPKGMDVIVAGENGNLSGDLDYFGTSDYSGPSMIRDVVYRGKGLYSVIDSKRGRIFTYDAEGNLLYIFGGLGSQAGTFYTPVAIEAIGNMILVLDKNRGEIQVFTETEYGQLINQAVALRYDGDETQAVDKWMQVLKKDENFELAAVGIGKAYLTAGDNEKAMHYLRLGNSRLYYSIAFKRYRNAFLKQHLGQILTVAIILVVLYAVIMKILSKKNLIRKQEEVW